MSLPSTFAPALSPALPRRGVWRHNPMTRLRRLLGPERRLQQGIVLGCVLALGTLWGGFAAYVGNREAQAIAQGQRDTANLALAFEQQTERTMRGVDQVMLFIKSDYERDPAGFDLQEWLRKSVFLRDLSFQISMTDPTGLMRMSSLGLPKTPITLKDREHFRVLADGLVEGLFISKPVLGRVSNKWSINVVRRLTHLDGSFGGVIVVSLDPTHLAKLFAEADLGERGAITLFGLDGHVRARALAGDGDPIGKPLIELPLLRAAQDQVSGTLTSWGEAGPAITSFRRVEGLPLVMAVTADTAELMAPVEAERATLLLIFVPLSVLLIGLFAGLLWVIERRQRQQALVEQQSVALDEAYWAIESANQDLEAKVKARTAELELTIGRLTDTRAELAAQEKMASLGRVVAGVAHEVNTPLGVAITASSSLTAAVESFDGLMKGGGIRKADLTGFIETAAEAADMISSNLARAASLVRSFKQVAADQHAGEPRQIDLGAYLRDIMSSLNPEIRKRGHKFEIVGDERILLELRVDSLWQVMSNLVMNALNHAYDDGKHGLLRIAVGREGGEAVIRFKDDGSGMPAEVRDNIFEPFFTTKRGAGGTGLGLSIVHTIVTRSLGGQIACESAPGAGTEFVIHLPLPAGA